MGDLSSAMRNVVDDIGTSAESRRSSAEGRHIKVSELKSDTHNLIERFRLEHQDMAKALTRKFSSDRATRVEAAQQLIDDLRSFMDHVRSDLQDSIRSGLQDMAKALKEELDLHRAARLEATQRFMSDTRSELQTMSNALKEKLSSENGTRRETVQRFLDELGSDLREARQIWETPSRGMAEETASQPIAEEEKKAEPQPVDDEESAEEIEASTENQVLEVVARQSKGIRLVDIGNELGVDWRGLIGVVKSLVDEDKIEKIDNLYYPRS